MKAPDASDRPRRSSQGDPAKKAAERDAAAFAASTAATGTAPEGGGLHRLLVDSVRDYAIFALDPNGLVLSWNEGARRIKGYEPGEIIGRHFSVFYPEHDVASGKPVRELEIANRDGRYEDEGWRVRKDGSQFWANVVITRLIDDHGKLVGFAKVTRDLTQRRRAEEELRESEERFRLIVHSVRDYGIFMLDPNGFVASWNQGAQNIKGYSAEDIIGRHFSTFYPEEDLANGKPAMELRVAARVGRFEDEGWRIRKDGTRFWANVIITALRNKKGTLVGFAKVTRDLTERKLAEERAIASARRVAEAEVANKAKSEFLAAMSHELRTPLNAIGGYTELLELGLGGPVTEQQASYLARIRGSQQHLLGIVTDLLNYSRIEAAQVSYDLAPVPMADVVERVLPLLVPQAAEKGVKLDRGSCPDTLIAYADRTKTEQIVLNLLSNAVKFTPAEGLVSVACDENDDGVSITVSDTGPGIPEDKQAAIFEPFVQLGRSLTSPHEGTGLGLAISRDLARAMGGNVTVRSTLGIGSAFTLTLPRA